MSKKKERNGDMSLEVIDSSESAFCSRKSPMTSEELEILAEMLTLKTEARRIKLRLSDILPEWKGRIHEADNPAIPDEAGDCLHLLNELRIRWKERERAYQEARHRRMVALGHEDP
jgi:hypothetical protein